MKIMKVDGQQEAPLLRKEADPEGSLSLTLHWTAQWVKLQELMWYKLG